MARGEASTIAHFVIGLAACLSATVMASAEPFEAVVGGEGVDRGISVALTRDGGFAVVGYTSSAGSGGEDAYLVRVGPAGRVLWEKSFGGAGDDNGWAIHQTGDGGFVLAGFTKSRGAGGFDCYLVKTDASGKEQWSATYGGESDDRCWSLGATSDGGFVLVGETQSLGKGAEDCYLVKTDALGKEVWSRVYGGEKSDRCFSIALVDDGGFMLAGQTHSFGAGDRDVYVVRTDAAGRLEWSRTYGGSASDVGHFVTATAAGSYVVTGYTTSFAERGDDPFLVKLDATGKTIWERVVPVAGLTHTLSGVETPEGGLLLAGFRVSEKQDSNSALLVSVDKEARLEWIKELFPTGSGRSLGYGVRSTPGGGWVVTGHTTEGSAGGMDLFVATGGRSPGPAPTERVEGPGSGSSSGAPAGQSNEEEEGRELRMTQAEQDRRIDYVEFSSTDLSETKVFYSAVLGWTFTDYGPEYTSFSDGRLAGGFVKAPDVAPGGPLVVIYATDLQAIEARIKEHGGVITKATFDFPGGRRFHFSDPSGNELAVWSDR